MATKKLTTVVIDALEDIKARDITLINVAKLTSVFDYIALASADSTRQTKALAKNVMDKVKESGGWIYGIEGEQSGEWVLVDCGDVVVHIMQPVMREHYKLEELWSEGKQEYPKPAAPRRKPVSAKAIGKVAAKARKKPAARPKAAAPATAKARTTAATAKVGKERKTVAKTKAVNKKVVTAKGVTQKSAPTTRKQATVTAVKKTMAGKSVARKPVTRRRKADA